MRGKGLSFNLAILFIFVPLLVLAAGTSKGKEGPPPGPVIVVDPGHGGRDPGALSRDRRSREKDLALSIAKKLAGSLEARTGGRVYLTRTSDRFVNLDQRNRLANWRRCDLFLSIHANSSERTKSQGLEIYYLNRASDEASRRLALRENQGTKRMEDLEAIVADLIQAAATEEAVEVAQQLRKTLAGRLKGHGVKEVRVKTALFYVLVGAKCPSLLIETGYLSNSREAKTLRRPEFQRALAEAIAEGVARYLRERSETRADL